MSKPTLAKTKRHRATGPGPAAEGSHGQLQIVSVRWIVGALVTVLAAAALCVWGALCFTFSQGSWQLLYHPTAKVTQTPADAKLAFSSIGFATRESGVPQLQGWWIPAASDASITVLYLHGANGNLGDGVEALTRLHAAGFTVFAIDYRGYGQSQFVHPSEEHWRQDAESALSYLEDTRHISAATIVPAGQGLGANLALEVAAAHPELAGVILDQPVREPMKVVFEDPRAHLVPAHWLVRDRWDLDAAAARLRIPSLWLCRTHACGAEGTDSGPAGFIEVSSPKMLMWLRSAGGAEKEELDGLARWTGDLKRKR